MLRAVIYTRISDDRHGGAGVGRQLADCEQLCGQRSWEVVERIEDNDRSAYSGKARPGYEKLLGLVAGGDVDVVVAWHSDRLWRSVLDQQVFLAAGRDAGLSLVATMTGDFEPGNADGEFFSTLMAAVARKESADKARRVRRKHQELAERGEFAGGPRAFGHTGDRSELVQVEADAIRDAVDRILAGGTVAAVVRDWDRRGLTTVFGNAWCSQTVKRLLVQPRLAGLRNRNGEIIGQAAWPAIIDQDDHHRLVALFAARKIGRRAQPGRVRLLTNLLVCGRCGTGMVGAGYQAERRYVCPPPERHGCSGTSIGSWVDQAVPEILFAWLDTAEFAVAVARSDDAAIDTGLEQARHAKEIGNGRGRLEELAELWADGQVTRTEWIRARQRIEATIADHDRALRALTAAAPLSALPSAGHLAAVWPTLEVAEQREILDLVFDQVVVGPGTPRHGPDLDRLQPRWLA